MFLKPIIFLSMTIALYLPAIGIAASPWATAIARDIDVQAGDVRITTERDGDKYFYTRRRWRRYPYSRSYSDWNRYRRSINCSGRGSVVRQETTQTNRSGSTVTRSSTSTYCR
jgi:hypothetical protein